MDGFLVEGLSLCFGVSESRLLLFEALRVLYEFGQGSGICPLVLSSGSLLVLFSGC